MPPTTQDFTGGNSDPGASPRFVDTTLGTAGAAGSDPAGGEQPDPSNSVNSRLDWHELVGRIQRGDNSGLEDLYNLFARGIRFYLCRQLGPKELDDKVQHAF